MGAVCGLSFSLENQIQSVVAVLAGVCDDVAGLKPFVRGVGRTMGNSIALHPDDSIRRFHVQRISRESGESGVGSRESGVGSRESGVGKRSVTLPLFLTGDWEASTRHAITSFS